LNDFVKNALKLNANHAVIVEAAKIPFNEDFRKLCEENSCGSFNRNWMCPPGVGSISHLIKRALGFHQGLLFQTVHQLEDSFDWEGMQEGQAKHEEIFRKILEYAENNNVFREILPLSAGPCMYCTKCAYLVGKECYFPDKAVSSVEANGIDVMNLLKDYQIPYNNGQNTVSYVGLILFKCI
jgi:Predicted metal-binding protein